MDYMQKFGLKPVDVRIKPSGLFDALRVYDAITYGGVRPTDVAKELEPAAFEQDDLTRQDYLRKMVNDDLKRGKLMIEERGYLRLVTRDYLDSRSRSSKR